MKKNIILKGVDIQSLIGTGDINLRVLEDNFSSQILLRGNEFHIEGDKKEVETIESLLHEMTQTLNRKGSLTQKNVLDLLKIASGNNKKNRDSKMDEVIFYGRKGGISARTDGQKKYVEISLLGKDKAQIISKLGKPSLIRKNISTYSMRFDKKNCITYVFFNTKQQNPLVQYFELRDNNGNLLINKKDINNCF